MQNLLQTSAGQTDCAAPRDYLRRSSDTWFHCLGAVFGLKPGFHRQNYQFVARLQFFRARSEDSDDEKPRANSASCARQDSENEDIDSDSD
jgi:hypothetical protein